MNKLNLGSGEDYKQGWINLDFNKAVKADVYADLTKNLPFKDNTFDYIYTSHVLEHIPKDKFFRLMEELHRILKSGGIIDIFVPHYTCIFASQFPDHVSFYGVETFRIFEEPDSVRAGYTRARFKVLKTKLSLVLRNYKNFPSLSKLAMFNRLFNFSKNWQLLMERLWFPGFDEIYYRLKAVK